MKKYTFLWLVLSVFFLVPHAYAAEAFFADDFVSQKEFWINNKTTCQAMRIHKNWFLTAAHCVEACRSSSCNLKMLLAVGEVTATANLSASDVFIPEQYMDKDGKANVLWDIALLHYKPSSYVYQTLDGGITDFETFSQAMKEDPELKVQWRGAANPVYPAVVVYSSEEEMFFNDDIVVPRWTQGVLSYRSSPDHILYTGKRTAMWVSDGFGVDKGNSGGGVLLENGNLLGVVSAKRNNDMPARIRQAFPEFAHSSEFFMFTGLSKKTTWPFVEKTLSRYGNRVKTAKLKRLPPPDSVPSL